MPIEYEDDQMLMTTDNTLRDDYANHCHCIVSADGVQLLLGKIQPLQQKKRHVHLHSKLFFSPYQAKRLALGMMEAVREYERSYGPIPTPSSQEPDDDSTT